MEVLFNPLEAYESRLREECWKNATEAFEGLVEASGVDAEANAAGCREIGRLEARAAGARRRAEGWKSAGVALWTAAAGCAAGAVLGAVGMWNGNGAGAVWAGWGAAGAVAAAVATAGTRRGARRAAARGDELAAEGAAAVEREKERLKPLMGLFRRNLPVRIAEKTLEGLKFDAYVSEGRLRELRETFGWAGEGVGEGGVSWVLAGEFNGNPFLIGRVAEFVEGTRTYKGRREVEWREKGGERESAQVQVLGASVEKPAPSYRERSFVVYANAAAEGLVFTRKSAPMAKAEPGSRTDRRTIGKCLRQLEEFAKARGGQGGFTVGEPEFEARFHAWDRNDEGLFRSLYTLAAQRQTLQLLRDRNEGFGDDFTMEKRGRVCVTGPEHLVGADLDVDPEGYRGHDLAKVRARFRERNEEWFRHVYFALAPLLAVPAYQQRRRDGAREEREGDGAVAAIEREARAYRMGVERFKPEGSPAKCVLKAEAGERGWEVVARGYRTVRREETVAVKGKDGEMHDVAVPWVEYVPVERRTAMEGEAGENVENGNGQS